MFKNIIIGILLLILTLLIFVIFLGMPNNLKETYYLSSDELEHYKDKALKCNIDAILKIEAYHAVNDQKKEYWKWKEKEAKCRKEQKIELH